MHLGELPPSLLQRAFAIGGELALHFLDQHRQRRFRIGRDDDVGISHVLEVL